MVVNGHKVFDQTLDKAQSVGIPLPRELFREDALTEIIFAHPDGFRPVDAIPGSQDTRLLSVALRSLQLALPE